MKKSAFEILGDRIKNFFHLKKLEDNENVNKVIDQFQKLYIPINEHLELEKKRSNADIIKSVQELKQALDKKKLDVKVNVPPAKIVVPKPLVKILKESKEAEKMVKLLESYLKLNLKFFQTKDGGTFITNREARDAVPVVLTDAGLKKFYNAISTAVSQSQDPFVDPSGHRRPANLDANGNLLIEVAVDPIDVELNKNTDSISIWSNTEADGSGFKLQPLLDGDGHLQIDVLTMPAIEVDFPASIEVSNFPSEYPLPDAQVIALTPPAAISGFATEAKQDTIITALGPLATQATLASILAKIIAAPATEAKQDTIITSLGGLATQATLASILAKIIAAPSTEAKQDAIIALITSLNGTDFATENSIQDLIALLAPIDFAMDSTLQDAVSGISTSNSWLEAIYNIDYQLIRDDAMTASTPTNATIGTTSATVVASNASRKGLILTNISTSGQRIDLAFSGQTALASKGVPLFVGGVYNMTRFDKTTGQVNGIATAAGAVIAIQEYT